MSTRTSPIAEEVSRLCEHSKHVLQVHKESLGGLSHYLATDKTGDAECRGKVVALALSLNQLIEATRRLIEQAQDLELQFGDDDDA